MYVEFTRFGAVHRRRTARAEATCRCPVSGPFPSYSRRTAAVSWLDYSTSSARSLRSGLSGQIQEIYYHIMMSTRHFITIKPLGRSSQFGSRVRREECRGYRRTQKIPRVENNNNKNVIYTLNSVTNGFSYIQTPSILSFSS